MKSLENEKPAWHHSNRHALVPQVTLCHDAFHSSLVTRLSVSVSHCSHFARRDGFLSVTVLSFVLNPLLVWHQVKSVA